MKHKELTKEEIRQNRIIMLKAVGICFCVALAGLAILLITFAVLSARKEA